MWEQLAGALQTLLIKAGAEDLADRVDAGGVQRVFGREGSQAFKAATTRLQGFSGADIADVLSHYGAGAAARAGVGSIKIGLSGDNIVGATASSVYQGFSTAAHSIWGVAAETGTNAYFNVIAGFPRDINNAEDIMQAAQAFQRHTAILGAFHSPAGRFLRSAGERFAVDTVNVLAFRKAIQVYDNSSLYQKETPREQSLSNIFIGSTAQVLVGSQTGKFRGAHPLLNVDKSAAENYGQRLKENLTSAKAYYGSNGPEALGSLIGGAGSYYATNYHQPYHQLARHFATAAIGRTISNAYYVSQGPNQQENLPPDPYGNIYAPPIQEED